MSTWAKVAASPTSTATHSAMRPRPSAYMDRAITRASSKLEWRPLLPPSGRLHDPLTPPLSLSPSLSLARLPAIYHHSKRYGEAGHPPLVGFGDDGILIYGRYLYPTQLGFQAPLLDVCGGHTHGASATPAQDPYGMLDDYHYHTQIFDATATSSAVADANDGYTATTTGPYNCYRANLTASKGSGALMNAASALSEGKNIMANRCCDMTDYYILSGMQDLTPYIK